MGDFPDAGLGRVPHHLSITHRRGDHEAKSRYEGTRLRWGDRRWWRGFTPIASRQERAPQVLQVGGSAATGRDFTSAGLPDTSAIQQDRRFRVAKGQSEGVALGPFTRYALDVQGFDRLDDVEKRALERVLRFSPAVCAALVIAGTVFSMAVVAADAGGASYDRVHLPSRTRGRPPYSTLE